LCIDGGGSEDGPYGDQQQEKGSKFFHKNGFWTINAGNSRLDKATFSVAGE
jgi:hypothetical protein